jgi:branched-chain amino acid transport system ATP-binding protein
MLAIGRALMGRPRILLLDEPSTGLAPSFYAEIFTKLGELNRKGLTLLIIDQEVRPLLKMAHRGYLMRNGRIIKEGPARILLEDPEVQTLY